MVQGRAFRHLVMVCLILAGMIPKLQAAECDKSLEAAEAPTGYVDREGQRCEGLFVSRESNDSMELVSLTYGKLPQFSGDPKNLIVTGPPAANEDLHLRAVGIPSALYYRMDTDLRPGASFNWPTKLLVHSIGIRLDQVGLFAFARSLVGDMVYYPVDVHSLANQPSLASSGVTIQLRPLPLVDRARWRFTVPGSNAPGWEPVLAREDLFTIHLNPNQSSGTLLLSWSDPETGARAVSQFRISF